MSKQNHTAQLMAQGLGISIFAAEQIIKELTLAQRMRIIEQEKRWAAFMRTTWESRDEVLF